MIPNRNQTLESRMHYYSIDIPPVAINTANDSTMAQANALQHRGGLDFFALARHSNQFTDILRNVHICKTLICKGKKILKLFHFKLVLMCFPIAIPNN